MLVDVDQKAKSPAGDSLSADSVDPNEPLEFVSLVGDEKIAGSLGLSSKAPLSQSCDAPGVLLDGPVLLDINSSVCEVEIEVQGAREGLAIKLGKGSEGHIGTVLEVGVARWEVEYNVRIEGVALDVLRGKTKKQPVLLWFQGRSDQ